MASGAVRGTQAVADLPDDAVLALARSDGFKLARRSGDEDAIRAYVAVIAQTGPHTNPTWITSQAVLSAYDRGLIDETELDCLSV